MKIKDFFKQYRTWESRRNFIINLVDEAVDNAGIYTDEDLQDVSRPDIIFYTETSWKQGFVLKPREKEIEFFFPIFQHNYDDDFDEEGPEPDETDWVIYTTVVITEDTDQIPKIIKFLSETGCLERGFFPAAK
ncbi:MAG: hypothetical protein WBG50_24110 [Desulfomonilaceae bacterium]